MNDQQNPEEAASVAIVGMAGRFPGASTVEDFWHNISTGTESITRFTDSELRAAGVSETDLADPRYVKAGAVLDGIEMFDAGFFGLTPRDAQIIDPQQRIFLETRGPRWRPPAAIRREWTGQLVSSPAPR